MLSRVEISHVHILNINSIILVPLPGLPSGRFRRGFTIVIQDTFCLRNKCLAHLQFPATVILAHRFRYCDEQFVQKYKRHWTPFLINSFQYITSHHIYLNPV